MDQPRSRHDSGVRLQVTHGEMNTATDQGDATPLGQGLGWLTRYQGGWWVDSEQGWLRVTDEATAHELDQVAGRLAEASSAAADDAAERLHGENRPGTRQAPGGSHDHGGGSRPARNAGDGP